MEELTEQLSLNNIELIRIKKENQYLKLSNHMNGDIDFDVEMNKEMDLN